MSSYFLLFTNSEYMIELGNFKYTFTIAFLIDIIIALVMMPFILRLSGQLLIQVIKYRLTIRSVNDPTDYIPYYEHYRLFFCVLLAMMCFNVVNLIKAFYLLKGLFLYVIEPISLSIVLCLWSAFQDAIISFGIISMVQVMYYLNNKKFNFLRYFSLIILRFVWVLVLISGVLPKLLSYYYNIHYNNNDNLIDLNTPYNIFLSLLIQFDSIIRFIFIFRIAKEANDLIKMRINPLLNDSEVRRLINHERVENMYRASAFFRFLSWGNFILASLYLFSYSLNFFSFYILSISYYISNSSFVPVYIYSVLFIEVIYILTSVLYCIFFLLLWKLYGSPRKSRFSGFSHFSQSPNVSTSVETTPILMPINLVGSQVRKVFLRFYSISIMFITVIIVAFITPLLINSWKSTICLDKANYYMLNGSNLYKAMHSCSYVTVSLSTDVQSDYICQDLYFASIQPNFTIKSKVYTIEAYQDSNDVFWLPKNSTLYGFTHVTGIITFIFPTEIPCYEHFTTQEVNSNPIYPSLQFDCLPSRSQNNPNITCHGISCETKKINFNQSGMINLSLSFDYNDKMSFYLQMYEPSTSSNKSKVLDQTQFDMDYNLILYEVSIDMDNTISFPFFLCCITFTCEIAIYQLGIALGILVTFPIYLFAAVICIHRH